MTSHDGAIGTFKQRGSGTSLNPHAPAFVPGASFVADTSPSGEQAHRFVRQSTSSETVGRSNYSDSTNVSTFHDSGHRIPHTARGEVVVSTLASNVEHPLDTAQRAANRGPRKAAPTRDFESTGKVRKFHRKDGAKEEGRHSVIGAMQASTANDPREVRLSQPDSIARDPDHRSIRRPHAGRHPRRTRSGQDVRVGGNSGSDIRGHHRKQHDRTAPPPSRTRASNRSGQWKGRNEENARSEHEPHVPGMLQNNGASSRGPCGSTGGLDYEHLPGPRRGGGRSLPRFISREYHRGPAEADYEPADEANGSDVSLKTSLENQEQAFPMLPPTGTPPPQKLEERSSASQHPKLDYSSLAERLAAHASAGAASKSDGEEARSSNGRGSDGQELRLSVLPGFEEGRFGRGTPGKIAKKDTKGSGGKRSSPPAQICPEECKESSKSRQGKEACEEGESAVPLRRTNAGGEENTLPSSQASSSAVGSKNGRPSIATLAAAALRERLRERWFRLEAKRKAERQREANERDLMAAEDKFDVNRAGRTDFMASDDGENARSNTTEVQCEIDEGEFDLLSDGSGSGNEDEDGGEDDSGKRDANTEADADMAATADRQGESLLEATSLGRLSQMTAVSVSRPRGVLSMAAIAAIRRAQEEEARRRRMEAVVLRSGGVELPLSAQDSSIDNPLAEEDSSGRGQEEPSSDTGRDLDKRLLNAGTVFDRALPGDEVREGINSDDGNDVKVNSGPAALIGDRSHKNDSKGPEHNPAGGATDGRDKLRRTALHLEAEAGELEPVLLRLKKGARLDQRDRWRETPLHKAARCGNPEIMRALCAARMKVNLRNRHRETPLLLAVRANSAEAVAVLLSYGARLDDPDVDGVTPVCEAAMTGKAELLMAMVNSNQSWWKHSRDRTDPTAMGSFANPAVITLAAKASAESSSPQWASSTGRDGSAGARRFPSSLRGSLRTGVSRGKGGGHGVSVPALSPLHEAAAAGQAETLSLLIDIGVSLEARDTSRGDSTPGDTALGRAVREGQLECARLLLDAGAMVNHENARGETPLMVAIRAGQASAVELLVHRGAPLDASQVVGGRNLPGSDGRGQLSMRSRMMARRKVEPLELALREGQLACAAVLIEGGARITVRALQATKLESPSAVAEKRSASPTPGGRIIQQYAGGGDSNRIPSGTSRVTDSDSIPLLQVDLLDSMSPEVIEAAESAPQDGGGLSTPMDERHREVHECFYREYMGLHSSPARTSSRSQVECAVGSDDVEELSRGGAREKAKVMHEGGLLTGLGECDVYLVLEDGTRLPAHSCLLATLSGAFRDLFMGQNLGRRNCRSRSRDGVLGSTYVEPSKPSTDSDLKDTGASHRWGVVSRAETGVLVSVGTVVRDSHQARDEAKLPGGEGAGCKSGHARPSAATPGGCIDPDKDFLDRASRVHAILADGVAESDKRDGEAKANHGIVSSLSGPLLTASAVAVQAIETKVCTRVTSRVPSSGSADAGQQREPDDGMIWWALRWGRDRGEVLVRSWGPGTMAAIVRHTYTGQPPSDVQHPDALARLLVAATSLRMPRLMRQVEHLISAILNQPRSAKIKDYHRAASALGASDLASWCTLLLQANGGMPEVMKMRRELGISSLNASDVERGLERLKGSSYLGSGPAHAWSSSTAVLNAGMRTNQSEAKEEAEAKRLVDLPLRKRAVDFDQLVPLLLDPARCKSALSVGRKERAALLSAAISESCPGFSRTNVDDGKSNPDPRDASGARLLTRAGTSILASGLSHGPYPCELPGSWYCTCSLGGLTAQPMASNFAAFSHGIGWLLHTGAMADVALILPAQSYQEEQQQEEEEEEEAEIGQSGSKSVVGPGGSEDTGAQRQWFLAHSVVLGARSAKFGAMLRFIRTQNDQLPLHPMTSAPDGEVTDGSESDIGSQEVAYDDSGKGWGETKGERHDADLYTDVSPAYNSPAELVEPTQPVPASPRMKAPGPVSPPTTTFEGRDGELPLPGRKCRVRRRALHELELQSPLLSARSLCLFMEFLYTGVLNPALSSAELSELALIADEYLVPELTRQVETLLVESLGGCAPTSVSTVSSTSAVEEVGAGPLELLQLGDALGLQTLSAAAARAVLMDLAKVSTSKVFFASGMTRRQLVLAALEAVR